MISVRAWFDDDEATAASVLLANEGQPGSRLVVPFDDHVLKEITETGFDSALVTTVDLEIVGDGALLADAAVGLHQHHSRSITEVRPAGGQFLE
jgi:hypothetical protein